MADENHEQSPETSGAQGDGQAGKNGKPEGKKPSRLKPILTAVIAILVIGGALFWFFTRNDIETDDAFTAGRAVGIAPHVEGYVVALLVNDNEFVHKGQILAKIDPRDWQASRDRAAASLDAAKATAQASEMMHAVAMLEYPGALMQAQGRLAEARAQEFKAQTDYRRQHAVARAATSQQDVDYAQAALDAARAQVTAAQGSVQMAMPVQPNIHNTAIRVTQDEANVHGADAELASADLNLGWTVLRAPCDGWISQRNIEQGNYVHKGQNVFAIVEPEVWVVANYKETQITRMKPGQKVDVRVDAYPSLKLRGHVDSLQKGTGATFSAFPPENATGNYVKIVQRVPVKIIIDEGLDPDQPLALGLSVEPVVHVDTQGHSDAPPPRTQAAAQDSQQANP